MTATWITAEAARAALQCSDRHLRRMAAAGEIEARVSKGAPGTRGRPGYEYMISSLPGDAQLRVLHAQLPPATSALALRTSANQITLFQSPNVDAEALRGLTDKQIAQARERHTIIEPLLLWSAGTRTQFATLGGQQIRTLDDLVGFLAEQHGVAKKTLYNWKRRYTAAAAESKTPMAGFKALADGARADRGTFRSLAKFPLAAEYVLIKYLGLAPSQYLEAARALCLPSKTGLDYTMPRYQSERLSITQVASALEREWPNLYNHGSQPPSYTTIRKFLNTLPAGVKTMARDGLRAYEEKCEPHLQRRFDMPVNHTWISDHRLFDVFCWNDYFPDYQKEQGAWLRVWLTGIEDERSRRLVGWAFSVNPSWRSVAAAMRMAIGRFGLPERLRVDNGEDYKKFGRILHENFGIACQHAKPFRPRSKAIESWHANLASHFDPLFGPAYAGHDAKDRSEDNTLALRQHTRYRRGDPAVPVTPLIPVSYLIATFGAWIEDEYHQWPHRGQGMNKLSPRQVFEQGYAQLPVEKRVPLDLAQMEPLFWDRTTRKVRNSKVELWKLDYVAADTDSELALRALPDGAHVRVACNPDDIAYALAYDIEGPDHRFIARLKAPELVPHAPESIALIEANEKKNAQYKKMTKQAVRVLGRHAIALGVRTELDVIAARAGIQSPQLLPAPQLVPALQSRLAAPAAAPAPYAADVADELIALEEAERQEGE